MGLSQILQYHGTDVTGSGMFCIEAGDGYLKASAFQTTTFYPSYTTFYPCKAFLRIKISNFAS